MPIRVTCACGHAMNVPDAYAGKSGKCPKCSQSIKIPAAGSAATTQPAGSKPAVAKPNLPGKTAAGGSTRPQSLGGAGGALDQLFAEAGLGKKTGPICPACQAAVKPGTVLCTACGFHIESGQKLQGHTLTESESAGAFGNKTLNAADKSLRKEAADDEAIKFVGWPWWVYLAFVFGLIMAIGFGVMRQDQARDENGDLIQAPADTLSGQIQRMRITTALAVISYYIAQMVASMASIAVLVGAFRDKISNGLLSLFVPLYIYYYAITSRKKLGKAAGIFLLWTLISIVLGIVAAVLYFNQEPIVEDSIKLSLAPLPPWLQSNPRGLS